MTSVSKKIFFQSLGCDKNLSDSEHMLSRLLKQGYSITDDETEADIIVVNTCCFIHDALQESIDTIIELGALKETGHLKTLVVAGCMAERYADEIKKSLPEVDAIVGTASYDKICEAIEGVSGGDHPVLRGDLTRLPDDSAGRVRSSLNAYGYLKIAEGCNKGCSYCVIPSVRGPYRSVPMEDLISEAKKMARDGVRELILVAQETTLYGTDIYGKKALPDLLRKLSEIEDLSFIRIMYCYPEEITEELLQTMASCDKVCHYLDLPIQHCSDRILSAMRRRTRKAELLEKIALIRKILPDCALRTTLICGFPGETEAEHEELLSFIKEVRFDHLGAFTYSQEDGTPAAEMPDQIDEETKKTRLDAVMALQQKISEENNAKLIGKTYSALVDGYLPEDRNLVCRIYRDAPDIDGEFFVACDHELMSGTLVQARVSDVNAYDYSGVLVDEDESAE